MSAEESQQEVTEETKVEEEQKEEEQTEEQKAEEEQTAEEQTTDEAAADGEGEAEQAEEPAAEQTTEAEPTADGDGGGEETAEEPAADGEAVVEQAAEEEQAAEPEAEEEPPTEEQAPAEDTTEAEPPAEQVEETAATEQEEEQTAPAADADNEEAPVISADTYAEVEEAAVTDMVESLTESEKEDIRKIFEIFSSDQMIDFTNFKKVMRYFGQIPSDDEFNSWFQSADKNGDDCIDFDEFCRLYVKYRKPSDEVRDELLACINKVFPGEKVPLKDVTGILMKLERHPSDLSEEALHGYCKSMDINNDGLVDKGEFIASLLGDQ